MHKKFKEKKLEEKNISFKNKFLKYLVSLAALFIILAGLKSAQIIIVPFLLAVFISVLASPSLYWMAKKKIPKILSIVIILFFILLLLVLIFSLITISLSDLNAKIPEYRTLFTKKINLLINYLNNFGDNFGVDINSQNIFKYVNPNNLFGFFSLVLTSLGKSFSVVVFIFLLIFFMLLEASNLPKKIRQVFKENQEHALDSLRDLIRQIKRYTLIKTYTSLTTGTVLTLVLIAFDIDYPFLWGFVAFFLNYIPNIGSIIASIPVILLGFLQYDIFVALWLGLIYFVINTIIGGGIEPKLLGRELRISTLVVFSSLVFWGWILGPVGMFLSIPLTMAVKLALGYNENTKWIKNLMEI